MLVLRCVYVVTQEMLLHCKANNVEPGSMKRAVMLDLRSTRYLGRDSRRPRRAPSVPLGRVNLLG